MSRPRFRPLDELLLPFHPNYAIDASRAADMLDCDVSTVRRMVESGELIGYKKRPDRKTSPFIISYDSVIAHIEKIHKAAGLEKRF